MKAFAPEAEHTFPAVAAGRSFLGRSSSQQPDDRSVHATPFTALGAPTRTRCPEVVARRTGKIRPAQPLHLRGPRPRFNETRAEETSPRLTAATWHTTT